MSTEKGLLKKVVMESKLRFPKSFISINTCPHPLLYVVFFFHYLLLCLHFILDI